MIAALMRESGAPTKLSIGGVESANFAVYALHIVVVEGHGDPCLLASTLL